MYTFGGVAGGWGSLEGGDKCKKCVVYVNKRWNIINNKDIQKKKVATGEEAEIKNKDKLH